MGSDLLLNQANTVGVIEEASVGSTVNFLRKLVQLSGGENDLSFLLCSDPSLNKELLSHATSSFPSLKGSSGGDKLDDTLIVEILYIKRAFLVKAGACCKVMRCFFGMMRFERVVLFHSCV